MKYLLIVSALVLTASSGWAAPCGPNTPFWQKPSCMAQQRQIEFQNQKRNEAQNRLPLNASELRSSPAPTENAAFCADLKTLRKQNLMIVNRQGEYAFTDTLCAQNELCLDASNLKAIQLLKTVSADDLAKLILQPACVAVQETTLCSSDPHHRIVKILLNASEYEMPIQCEKEESSTEAKICQAGKCVSQKAALCVDSDKTVVENGKPDWKSIVTSGQVKLATGEVKQDLCKDQNLLQEQYCDPVTGAAKMVYIGCSTLDPSGQCTNAETGGNAKCVFGTLQYDKDKDLVPDGSDNCPITYNPDQSDADKDGFGDACAVNQVAVGGQHACIVVGATVSCWGSNQWGQLGVDPKLVSSALKDKPIVVPNLTPVKRIAAGYAHTCAILVDGETVRCWGRNDHAQLGNNDKNDSFIPVSVQISPSVPLKNAFQIALGSHHGCALLNSGSVECWGSDAQGQIGYDKPQFTNFALQVLLPKPATWIATGSFHTCAVLQDGSYACWGNNYKGELGDLTTAKIQKTPIVVPGVTKATQMALGVDHTCLVGDTMVTCWGLNDQGQLGDPKNTGKKALQYFNANGWGGAVLPILGLGGIKQISSAGSYTCAVLQDGTLSCWGSLNNVFSITPLNPIPFFVSTGPFKQVSVGDEEICVITQKNEVVCWSHKADGMTYSSSCDPNNDGDFGDVIEDPLLKKCVLNYLGGTDAATITKAGMLYCHNQGITNLNGLQCFSNLQVLMLNSNQISDIFPVTSLVNLKWLYLGTNKIGNIKPLAGLVNLVGLSLYSNQVSELSPLAGLVSLEDLNMDLNMIKDLTPLSGMVKLNAVSMKYNAVLSDIQGLISNPNLGSGDSVELDNCPQVPKAQIDALKAKGVTVKGP